MTLQHMEDIIEARDYHRDEQHLCPRCGGDCWRIGLVRLAYMFATCECDRAPYPHLVEQLWHIECLTEEAPAIVERELLDDCLYWLKKYKRTQQIGLVERIEKAMKQ